MPFRRALLVAAVTLVATAPLITPALGTEPTAESEVMRRINAGRSDRLVVHSGLLAVARAHSQEMASHGSLDHNDADARIRSAPPDPYEINGAPDDGSPPASWCENVTYSVGTSESEASQRIYDAWEGSGAHGRCMNDTSRNVGAVGIYYDGQSWWATFIAMVDNTPPGAPPAPRATPTAAPRTQAPLPAPTQAPARTDVPVEPSPEGMIASIDATPVQASARASVEMVGPPARAAQVQATVNHPGGASSLEADPLFSDAKPASVVLGYGWQELSAVAALLVLATFVLMRAMRPVPEVERRDDVALPEGEPVGAGAMHA
jgi:uncharacterized protein YkwD